MKHLNKKSKKIRGLIKFSKSLNLIYFYKYIIYKLLFLTLDKAFSVILTAPAQ